ncbi:efflux RND transporter periplasmic adaptor subunit [Brucella anthropi]|uniref:efflux RND transporter periplasmic adaptor subunit n=1 Tax=Brucella anthropi TaxID=529 RepID=UPI000DEC9B1C|nr:efflux RND transporter periplasmic adaptor subunit [Brucella anthropi]RCI81280.1 efflux RND transporter periplasmic adaptor subunit [Brucella anthropi]
MHRLRLSKIPFRMIGLGLTGILLAACDDNPKIAEPSPQSVRVVEAAMLEQRRGADISGEVRARIQTDLAFRVAGKVVERRVDVGAHVRAGDVLARIDDTEQRADIESAEAGLRAAQATLNQKTLAYRRYETLVETRAIAQATYDQAKEELATAQGTLESAQASLAIAKDALSRTELKAEADGIITARSVEVGQVVSAAQPAFTLAHDGPREAVFDVFEAFFLAGQPIGKATVAPIANPDTGVTATLREIAPVIDTTKGTIRVKMALPEDIRWSLGTPVVGNFRTPSAAAIALPWSAMTSADGKPAVWIVDAATRSVALRPITIARYRTGEFVIAGGISTQELVVSEGGKFLRPGQTVTWESD